MADQPPKLKVFRTVLESYVLVFRNWRFVLRAGVPWVLLVIALLVAYEWAAQRFGMVKGEPMFAVANLPHELGSSLIQVACLTLFAIRWHRHILLSDVNSTSFAPSQIAPSQIAPNQIALGQTTPSQAAHYAGFAFLIEALVLATFTIGAMLSTFEPVAAYWIVPPTVSFVLAVYMWCRVMFVLPAIALGRDSTFGAAWRSTSGNVWRLMAGSLTVLMVPLAPYFVYWLIQPDADEASVAEGRSSAWDFWSVFGDSTWLAVIGVFGLSFLTIAYRALVLRPAQSAMQ
jgi:hypothetical protein